MPDTESQLTPLYLGAAPVVFFLTIGISYFFTSLDVYGLMRNGLLAIGIYSALVFLLPDLQRLLLGVTDGLNKATRTVIGMQAAANLLVAAILTYV